MRIWNFSYPEEVLSTFVELQKGRKHSPIPLRERQSFQKDYRLEAAEIEIKLSKQSGYAIEF